MNARTIVGVAALLVSLVASTALAQPAGPSKPEILEDLRENNLSAEEVLAVTAMKDLRVVSLKGFTGADLQDLAATLDATEDHFVEIRSAIERNQLLEAALREQNAEIGEIFAATRSDAGVVSVYIDRPPMR